MSYRYITRSKLLEGKYRLFIINRLAQWKNVKSIFNELSDPNARELYGFAPYKGSYNNLYNRQRRIPKEEIFAEREKWLSDLRDIPLAQKKVRILALCKIYNDSTNATVQARILDQIRVEVGEDRMLKAVADSGKTTVNVTLQEKTKERVQEALINNRISHLLPDEKKEK